MVSGMAYERIFYGVPFGEVHGKSSQGGFFSGILLIRKIISGARTVVDRAAIDAAIKRGAGVAPGDVGATPSPFRTSRLSLTSCPNERSLPHSKNHAAVIE